MLEGLVDGCLASFHHEPDATAAARVADRPAQQLSGVESAELIAVQIASRHTVFAGAPYRAHPSFVQLSPNDHRCLVGSLEVVEDATSDERTLSGRIYGLDSV